MSDTKEIPDDIAIAAEQTFEAILTEAYKEDGFCGHYRLIGSKAREIIATAILKERHKGDKSADEGYLTGVGDAYTLAARKGFQDFADILLKEINTKARRSGLPELKVRA